jgi:hypothetical protein
VEVVRVKLIVATVRGSSSERGKGSFGPLGC